MCCAQKFFRFIFANFCFSSNGITDVLMHEMCSSLKGFRHEKSKLTAILNNRNRHEVRATDFVSSTFPVPPKPVACGRGEFINNVHILLGNRTDCAVHKLHGWDESFLIMKMMMKLCNRQLMQQAVNTF